MDQHQSFTTAARAEAGAGCRAPRCCLRTEQLNERSSGSGLVLTAELGGPGEPSGQWPTRISTLWTIGREQALSSRWRRFASKVHPALALMPGYELSFQRGSPRRATVAPDARGVHDDESFSG
jgi:hypothetical protein